MASRPALSATRAAASVFSHVGYSTSGTNVMFAIVLVQNVPSFSLLSLKIGFAECSVIARYSARYSPIYPAPPTHFPRLCIYRGTKHHARRTCLATCTPSASHERALHVECGSLLPLSAVRACPDVLQPRPINRARGLACGCPASALGYLLAILPGIVHEN